MLKNILLLLLVAPLGWEAFLEARRLFAPPAAAAAASPADISAAEAALKTAEAKGAEYGGLKSEALDRALRMDDMEAKRWEAARAGAHQDVVRAIEATAAVYADTHKFLQSYMAASGATPPFKNPVLKDKFEEWIRQREQLVKSEKHMEDLFARLPGTEDALRKEIARYRDRSFSNRAQVSKYLAHLDRKDLEKQLADQLKKYKDALDGRTDRAAAKKAVGDLLAKLQMYLDKDDYKPLNESDPWARNQAAEWQGRLRLLEVVDYPAAKLDELVQELNALTMNKELSPELRGLVRDAAGQFFNRYLDQTLQFDTHVMADDKRVPREKISVTFKLNNMTMKLIATGLNEKTLDPDKVNLIYDGENSRTVEPSKLKGTPKTEAAHAFNVARAGLQWNEASLNKLYEDCKAFMEELKKVKTEGGDVWSKLERVRKIAKENPDLFGG